MNKRLVVEDVVMALVFRELLIVAGVVEFALRTILIAELGQLALVDKKLKLARKAIVFPYLQQK
jgi:hypothetical protein